MRENIESSQVPRPGNLAPCNPMKSNKFPSSPPYRNLFGEPGPLRSTPHPFGWGEGYVCSEWA